MRDLLAQFVMMECKKEGKKESKKEHKKGHRKERQRKKSRKKGARDLGGFLGRVSKGLGAGAWRGFGSGRGGLVPGGTGRTDIWMDVHSFACSFGRTDGQKFPLCSIGHRPLWACCPKSVCKVRNINLKFLSSQINYPTVMPIIEGMLESVINCIL